MQAPEQCVILNAGPGTGAEVDPDRLRPDGESSLLDGLLWHLKRFGFRRVVIGAGESSSPLRAYAGAAQVRFGLGIEVAEAPVGLGTAGSLRRLLPRLDELFLLLHGRGLFDINLLDLVPLLAGAPDAALAVALRRTDGPSGSAAVELVGERVLGFRDAGGSETKLADGGVSLVRTTALADLPACGSLQRDVLPSLAGAGAVRGRPYDGPFIDASGTQATDDLVRDSLRRPAVFFDRDGVLNRDCGYVGTLDRFEWTPTAIEAVKLVNDSGFLAFLVTNQSGVARGYFGEAEVRALHAHMAGELRPRGAHLDDVRFCPHHPEGSVPGLACACACRKPEPGMILDLLSCWPVDKARSLLVGDKPSDVAAARRAGIAPLLFEGGDLRAALEPRLSRRRGAHPREAIDGRPRLR